MYRHIGAAFWAGALWASERAAEVTWPNVPAITWWSVAAALFVLGLLAIYFPIWWSKIRRTRPDPQTEDSGPNWTMKSRSQKAIGIEESPQLDRQPINQAYEYLAGLKVVKEDGMEPMQVAGLLRQAALDGEIMIWGSEPSLVPVERQAPILLEINRGYWRHHGINPASLMIDASELPDKGCETQRGHRHDRNDQTECYWHLHVDMKQVRTKWTDIHEARL